MTIQIYKKDCLEFIKGLKSESIDLVFADPPFNVGIKYKGYIDNISTYQNWCATWIDECFRVLKSTGTFYLMTIDRHLEWKMPIMAKHGSFINLVKWKNVSANHDKNRYWNATQPIMVYGKTNQYKFNTYAQTRNADQMIMSWNKDRAKNAKFQLLDYWDDIPLVFAGSIKHKEAILEHGTNKKAHPCQMPEMLPGRAILFSTEVNDIILDPFMGSGTTAIACKKLNRNFIGCDISEAYFKLTQKRIKEYENCLFSNT
jgi:site-specific DNA-methyltransferase (adenine-specific)